MTALLVAALLLAPGASAQTSALKIAVIAGEDAVNIVQQKTAVAPIVEVRDRNDQPVVGVTVTFAIAKGRATFNGARTLTVTTDGAGRATAIGLTPTGTGPLQVSASATVNGQTTTATISQVNAATAAQAASVTPAAGTAVAAGGAAATGITGAGGAAVGGAAAAGSAGAGGGLSGIAIGSIVAGAAGGTFLGVEAATGRLGGDSGSNGSSSTTYTGPFSGQWSIATTTASNNSSTTCVATHAVDGTLKLVLDKRSDGTVSGSADISGSELEVSVTASPFCSAQPGSLSLGGHYPLTGTSSSFGFSFSSSGTGATPNGGGSVTCTDSTGFSGGLSGGTVSGNVSRSRSCQGNNVFNGVSSVITGSGSGMFPVTLH